MLQKKVTYILYCCMDTKRNCKKCNNLIPYRVVVDGVQRNLKNRKFCLSCSPFGKHNTKDITKTSQKKVCSGDRVSQYRRRLKGKLFKSIPLASFLRIVSLFNLICAFEVNTVMLKIIKKLTNFIVILYMV